MENLGYLLLILSMSCFLLPVVPTLGFIPHDNIENGLERKHILFWPDPVIRKAPIKTQVPRYYTYQPRYPNTQIYSAAPITIFFRVIDPATF